MDDSLGDFAQSLVREGRNTALPGESLRNAQLENRVWEAFSTRRECALGSSYTKSALSGRSTSVAIAGVAVVGAGWLGLVGLPGMQADPRVHDSPAPALSAKAPGGADLRDEKPSPIESPSWRVWDLADSDPADSPDRVEKRAPVLEAAPREGATPKAKSPTPSKVSSQEATTDEEQQLLLIDRARSELRGRKPQAALSTLDELGRRFTSVTLSDEATVLRTEALLRVGRKAEALALGQRFMNDHSGSIYIQRLSQLLAREAP